MAKIGREGGTVKTTAQAEAVRRNGKLGGPPRRRAPEKRTGGRDRRPAR